MAKVGIVMGSDSDMPVMAKAAEILGWHAEFGIEDMCRDMANWQKKNPNGYEN